MASDISNAERYGYVVDEYGCWGIVVMNNKLVKPYSLKWRKTKWWWIMALGPLMLVISRWEMSDKGASECIICLVVE